MKLLLLQAAKLVLQCFSYLYNQTDSKCLAFFASVNQIFKKATFIPIVNNKEIPISLSLERNELDPL